MKNIYVEKFKDIIESYNRKQKELNDRIKANSEKYTAEYLDTANAPYIEEQEKLFNEVQDKIKKNFHEVREYLTRADYESVEELTADTKLFSSDSCIDLSVDRVRASVEQYKNNYTMLKYIKGWIEKNNNATDINPLGKYKDIEIILPKDIITAYKHFGEGALAICNRIYKEQTQMQQMIDLNIQTYTDERFVSKLYNIVRDGNNLSDFRMKRVPDSYLHTYDDIDVKQPNANYYMAM